MFLSTSVLDPSTTSLANQTEDSASCDPGALHASNDTCKYVKENCDDQSSDTLKFNPIEFTYCTLNGGNSVGGVILSLVVQALFLVLWFYLLGSTADDFFCPALEELTETLKMSPNVAGVTFLAFGNGAPDVFSNIAAFSGGNQDLGLSGLLGAGIFVTTYVIETVYFRVLEI